MACIIIVELIISIQIGYNLEDDGQCSFSDLVFTVITSIGLDPSYPAATPILASTLATSARIWQTFRDGENNFRDEQTATSHKTVRHGICSQGGISKWCLHGPTTAVDNKLFGYVYLHW